MLYNLDHILNDIETSILQKKPFSIARLGDGDLKLLVSSQANLPNPWKFQQQGIPLQHYKWICDLYKNSCNNANYVSSFDLYFDGSIWKRPMSAGMRHKIRDWKKIYKDSGIINENYCSPEIGFLFFLDEPRNLFSILKEKRICLITCFEVVEMKLRNLGYNVGSLIIPGRNQNQFQRYHKNIKRIIRRIQNYDVFLVGAGSLGRGYSNCIKNHGGIAIDIGQVFDAWAGRLLAKRIKNFVTMTNVLTFQLNSNSILFRKNF
jgi:hypothetical protein